MFDEKLRPLKEKLLNPVSRTLGRVISPNQMSLFSLLLGAISIYFIYRAEYINGLIFWTLNRITDGLDGTIARVTGRQSDFGGYLDIMIDFLIYSSIPIVFVISRGRINIELLVLSIMLGVYYCNAASWMYLSSILEKRGSYNKLTSINMPLGVVEGFETIIIYTLFYILPQRILLLFIIMSCLTLLGTIQRVIWSIKNIK